MANALNTNPLSLDTPGATVLVSSRLKIQRVIWKATTLGDNAEIQDKDGNTIWKWTAEATPDMVESNIGDNWYNGLKMPTLGSGTLYVYKSTQ